MMRLFFAGAVAVIACGAYAQLLPNKDSLSLDEQGAWIVTNPRVEKELKLETSQESKVTSAFSRYSASQQHLYKSGAPTEADLDRLDHSLASSVLGILSATQKQRLHQIVLQLSGPAVIQKAAVATALGLKPEQRSSVSKIIAATEEKEADLDEKIAQALIKDPKASEKTKNEIIARFEPQKQKVEESREEDKGKILNVLTPAQRQAWDKMLGAHLK